MLAAASFNCYVNSDAFKPVPGAPKKVKVTKTRDLPAPVSLDFGTAATTTTCPGAPKKVKMETARDTVNPLHLDFLATPSSCPGAPKKVMKARTLEDRENVTPVRLFQQQEERKCPGAPKKAVKAVARTPLPFLELTSDDLAEYC